MSLFQTTSRRRYQWVRIGVLVLLLGGLANAQSFHRPKRERAAETVSTETVQGRMAVFDEVWQTIFEYYYDPNFNGIDWENLRTVFRPQAAEAKNGSELYAVLKRLLANLSDVHTRVFAPEEKFAWWSPRFVGVGISVREIEGKPVVVRVEKGSAPEAAGVRPGDLIEEINDVAAETLVTQRLEQGQKIARNRFTQQMAFASILEGPFDTPIVVKWRGKDAKLRQASFSRRWQTRKLGFTLRKENGVLVAEIDAFTPTIARDFNRELKRRLPGVRGIVIDLRQNGGGETESMADVAASFLGLGFDLGTFKDRWGLSFSVKTKRRSLIVPATEVKTDLPIAVLISERTSSAAEIFAFSMQQACRATLIGHESCGCVLAVRSQRALPDGGALNISELDYHTSDGTRLQGNSVRPDLSYTVSREDLYSGRDPGLELALKHLSRNATARLSSLR